MIERPLTKEEILSKIKEIYSSFGFIGDIISCDRLMEVLATIEFNRDHFQSMQLQPSSKECIESIKKEIKEQRTLEFLNTTGPYELYAARVIAHGFKRTLDKTLEWINQIKIEEYDNFIVNILNEDGEQFSDKDIEHYIHLMKNYFPGAYEYISPVCKIYLFGNMYFTVLTVNMKGDDEGNCRESLVNHKIKKDIREIRVIGGKPVVMVSFNQRRVPVTIFAEKNEIAIKAERYLNDRR